MIDLLCFWLLLNAAFVVEMLARANAREIVRT